MIRLDAQIPLEAFADPAVPEVVEVLEDLLLAAQRGAIVAVGVVAVRRGADEGTVSWVCDGDEGILLAVGAGALKVGVLADVTDDPTEEDDGG